MKRVLGAAMLCLLLTGCGGYTEGLREPVTFYYVSTGYREDMSSPIGSEQREASGHQRDLMYLLSLYLMGPTQNTLRSPLPRGTKVQSLTRNGSSLTLVLTDTEKDLSESDYTLACACLSRTLLEITDAQSVTVSSGDRSITMTESNVSTYDSLDESSETEETQ